MYNMYNIEYEDEAFLSNATIIRYTYLHIYNECTYATFLNLYLKYLYNYFHDIHDTKSHIEYGAIGSFFFRSINVRIDQQQRIDRVWINVSSGVKREIYLETYCGGA